MTFNAHFSLSLEVRGRKAKERGNLSFLPKRSCVPCQMEYQELSLSFLEQESNASLSQEREGRHAAEQSLQKLQRSLAQAEERLRVEQQRRYGPAPMTSVLSFTLMLRSDVCNVITCTKYDRF